MDIFRLLVIEQSNDVLKQVVIAYEIYPHWHNYPKKEVIYITLLLFQTCFFLVLPYFKWLKINIAMDNKNT